MKVAHVCVVFSISTQLERWNFAQIKSTEDEKIIELVSLHIQCTNPIH